MADKKHDTNAWKVQQKVGTDSFKEKYKLCRHGIDIRLCKKKHE